MLFIYVSWYYYYYYLWKNGNRERFKNLPKASQLVSGRAGARSKQSGPDSILLTTCYAMNTL